MTAQVHHELAHAPAAQQAVMLNWAAVQNMQALRMQRKLGANSGAVMPGRQQQQQQQQQQQVQVQMQPQCAQQPIVMMQQPQYAQQPMMMMMQSQYAQQPQQQQMYR
jgi:hypothetical protein